MRIIKNIIAGLLGLSILIFLFSLLFSSTIKVNRDVIINATPQKVHADLINMKSWPSWYAGLNDGGNTIAVSPNTIKWVDARQKLNAIKIISQDSLNVEVEFESAGKRTQSRFILHSLNETSTRVEWQSLIELGWLPWNKFKGMYAENMMAPAMEASLKDFKSFLESNMNVTLRLKCIWNGFIN